MYKNKFFIGGDSSSSSEDSSDDDEQINQTQTTQSEIFYVSYNVKNNDNEENVKRIVRNEKEKCYEELEEIVENIKEAIDIRDIGRVHECFENLIKVYDKGRQVFEEEEEEQIPQFYIEILNELDTFVNQCWKDGNRCNQLNKLRRELNNQLHNISSNTQESTIDTNMNEEDIIKKLNEISFKRGKRGINYQKEIKSLNKLREFVEKQNFNVEIIIKILLIQITFDFDSYRIEKEGFQVETWTHAFDSMEELLKILNTNSFSHEINDELLAVIHQMDEEFRKVLQTIDPYSQDYIERLKDEYRICSILDQFKHYFELNNQSEYICSIYLCILEHIYYKSNNSSLELINQFCTYIYTNTRSNRLHIRTILCQIYSLALHDYYHQARNLMLMSHLQDTIESFDISTQILYNRTIVQLGLCAFRKGEINEAYQALMDIQSKKQIKQFLGHDYLPYHMHINLEIIECIYLISSMLKGKCFRRLMVDSPESIREYVIAANHAMQTGDWKTCMKFLFNEKMNSKLWKFVSQSSEVIDILMEKIKEESLRIYVLNYVISCFSSISIATLAEMFELTIRQVYGIISKMIINQELMASIEESNEYVVIHDTNSSKIRDLSNELMDKMFRLHKQNEKLNSFSRNNKF